MAINYDEATGGYTEESTTLKPNSNGTINVDEASYVASVNDIHKGTSIVNSANDTSALAETIDNSTTIYVTGTGAYTPNVNLIDEGKIVFGKKDAAFDGTYAGTIDGQASNLATVQVLNGSLTLESGATIDLIGNFDKERGFILGTVDAAEDDGTMTAVVTVKEGATLNARNYFWIGSANGSYETPEEQSERFKLIIDGGKVDATSNAFTLRNTGAMEILNGGSFSAHDGSVRNYISVTGEGSYLEYGGNVYGEAPSGAEGAPTYGTAYITVSDGATANFTNLSIGGEGASRENRRGSVTLSNATATAKTILLSLANEDEEIRAELSVENSSLTAETITSYGAFNVSGTSTLNIDTLNIGTQEPQDDPMLLLDNAVTLLDGAVLTDSNVGGIVSTEGDVTIAGATTLGQLVLEGSRGDERTIVIDENANVTLNDQKNTNFGVLDVGIGLQKPSVTTQDPNPRQYYGQVLVKGNLSVENYNADTGEGRAGAIYIRPYAELVVTGTLNVKGEVHNRGSLVVDGGTMNMSVWATPKLLGYTTGDSMTVTNKGTMTVSGASAVTFGEASASLQHMEVVAQYEDGMFATISAGGKFEADTLAFANDDDVTLTVTGEGSTFTLYSADGRTVAGGYTYAQNEGEIIIEDNAVFDVSELANDNFVNTGTIDISSATATFATLTNNGTVNVTGNATLAAEFMAAGTGLLNLNSVAFGSGTSVNDTASYTNNTIGSEIVMTGTNTLTDGAFVSTGWSKNFRLGYNTGTESDSLEITGGATLKVGGNSYIGSAPEDKGASAYQVTVSGAGSSFAGSGAGGDLYLRRDGQLTVKDDASASFSYADIKGSVVLENGNFSFINSRLIGTIAMDYASTLTFSGEINSAGGAITVDMNDFSGGVYKLIDYTGSNSYTEEQYKALIGEANWNENFTIVNNDLYAVNVDTSTLKVNAAWSGTAIGTEVAEGFYYGFNAFDTFQDAYMSGTDAVTIKIGSDLDNVTGELGLDAPYRSDIQISSEDGNNYTLAFGSPSSDGLYAWNAGQTITIDKEISLVNMAQLMAVATDTVVTIDGNVTSMQLWAGFGGTVNITETATVTLTYGDGWLTLRDGGTVNVKGTVENASTFDITSAQAQFDLGYSSIGDARSSNNYAGSTNVFNMTNTFVDGGAWLNLGAATWDSGRNSVNMTNSVFKVNALNMYNDGQFNVGNGSRVIVNGALKAAEESVLNITDDSSVSVKTLSVEAAAQVNMDYTSTLAFGDITNNGTITIDMSGYQSGVYKLLDYTGTGGSYNDEAYKTLLGGEENWSRNFAVFENDLYVATADTSRIAVDDDWTGKTVGDIVTYGDEYFLYGGNAFDNLSAAVVAAADEATILVADGTYNESVVVSGNRNLEIGDIKITSLTLGTKDEAFTGSFSMGSLAQVSGGASTTNGSLVLVNGPFTITDYTTAILCLGSSDLVNVTDEEAVKTTYTLSTGSVTVTEHFYVGCADPDVTKRHGYYTMTVEGDGALTVKKTLNVRQDGVFKVTGSSTDVNLSQFLVYGKSEISNNAEVSAFNLQIYNDDNEAQLSVTDSSIKMQIDNLGGTVYIGDRNNRSGSLILERSQLEANIILLGGTDGENQSQLNLNQSNLSVDKTFSITEGGILNLTDSTLTAANTITNNGTINVAGTSTVEAEIGGALDLLDGADVTFAGGAKDLLVASGAEVTLRGELSGREVISEKDHMYNSEDAQGITVNIDSGEGTTFQSYAWYASNGSTYNVQSGSSAEITYANINATGTINVAEGATLTTVKESSNIVGTMNVDGTVNSVMTVYAGYTGGAYADDAQAGLVNITGTANSSIVTIGTAVRDDDKYNAAATEGGNTTAAVVVNGGTLNASGTAGELTSKLFVGSTDYAGTLSAINGTINVGENSAAGTGYMRFIIGENGTLNLDNSTMTVYNLGGKNNSAEGVFQNSGAINMDLDSLIVTATALNNLGTITVDMTGAAEFGVYKLIDYTGSGIVTAYGNVEFTNNGYDYTESVLDNDLYLVRADGAQELYVNSQWKGTAAYDEVTFVDGTTAYYGLNAFDTVDNAVKSLPADDPIRLNVTGDIGAITVVGKDVTEVNASAKPADITEDTVIDTDAIVVNLVEIDNTDAGWQVYYPLAGGSVAAVYGNVTTNFLSTTFTAWGEKTADPNFIGGAYAGSTATVYGNTTVNLGAADAADDALMLDTSFLMGAGAGTVNGNSSVNINSGTIQANAIVGGGAWRGQVKGDSSVTISGGQITVNSTEDSPGRAIIGGSYGNVSYDPDAPGDPAATAGKSSVTITGDAVVSGKVVGGSDISAVTNSSVTISGQAQVTGNVYGGGNRGGQVKENAAVTIADSAVLTGNVYGGGFGPDTTDSIVQGSTSVTLSGGTVTGNVYAGGSNSSVAGDAAVTLTGGTVGGDVYGSGEGSGTVAGASTLNVGAADAAFYTTTLNNVYDFDLANITNAAVTVDGVFAATQISIADSALTLNSGFDTSTTTVSIEVGAFNAENAALVLDSSAVGTAPAISISGDVNALTEARYLVATGFDDLAAFSLEESLAEDYLLRAVDGNIYLYNADAPYFTTELSVTQAEGASVDGNYTFTANFEAEGLLLTGYTLKLYDSATATTPIDEITLGADVVGQEFTFANTVQNFWISVTANGENGQSTDSPTSGRLEVAVQDHDSPVILSVTSDAKSDSVTLACEATDNFGVTGYEFILDGQSLGVQSGSQLALDISNLAAGTHSYTVNVYDAAGNLAGSAEQSFEFTPAPGPGPEPTVPASFLYSSQVRVNNGETVTVYANYSNTAAVLEYRIGDTGDWLTYDATTGVNVSSSTTVYFREQGITDPVETAVDVTVVPADVELNAEVILLAPTTDTTYEVIYNFADGGSKAVELSGNSVEHYALPEDTKITIVEKDASGEVVNTIVEETPAASTTAEIPDKVVAVDDGHDNLFFAMPVGKWTGNRAQHQGDGVWGGTLEVVSLTGKNRFSTVFTGSDDATTLFLTDDANGDAFFLDDIYTANGSDARIRKMSEIQAGAGDDIVDLTSVRYAYEEHASKQLVIRGGDGNDILWGNAGHNIMFGDDGNDRIYGGSDNDVLIGGTGNDTMLGGGGDDIFCYGSSFDWGSDTITQLSGGTVTLYLDGIDRNDCSISGSTLTWNDGTHTGSITLNGVSWDSVKFYCAANGDSDLTKQSDYEELKNKGAFAAISSH